MTITQEHVVGAIWVLTFFIVFPSMLLISLILWKWSLERILDAAGITRFVVAYIWYSARNKRKLHKAMIRAVRRMEPTKEQSMALNFKRSKKQST